MKEKDYMRKLSINQLKTCQKMEDREKAHVEADQVLCALLVSLGYEDVVEQFNKCHKWYA